MRPDGAPSLHEYSYDRHRRTRHRRHRGAHPGALSSTNPDGGVTLQLSPPLRSFLPAKRRAAHLQLPVDGTSTVGHLLAALGVPKTEVGEVRVDGKPIDLGHRPADGQRIAVSPRDWPQPTPTTPPRFVLDVHLGTLARRLRLLGIDTAYDRHAEDAALLETSLAEHRVLLTRDRGLLHRRALRWGAHVNQQQPDRQLDEVLDRFEPPLRPWTRCLRCNGPLLEVAKDEVDAELEAGTRRSYEAFRRCASCGQIYWRGAHADRLHDIVQAATTDRAQAPL